VTATLGPIPASDSRFMRRVRLHQAWYRTEVLGISGYGTLAVSGQPCASVLPDEAAELHLNFVGQDAVERYLGRRQQGWGVDPIRCTKYLTSSQTLTFNMLAQAVGRPEECARLFNRLLHRSDLGLLESSAFEFAAQGTRYGLGDKTLVDMLLRFRTNDGSIQVVALETKLADRFSTRRTAATGGAKYLALAGRSALWTDLEAAVGDNRTRQLTRCHALAQSVQEHDEKSDRHAILLVLMHPEDRAGGRCTSNYTRHVAPGAVVVRTWDEYLSAARSAQAIEDSTSQELHRRYVDLAWSELAWRTFEESSGSSSRRSASDGIE
jgi:hypothetical protein